MHLNLCASLPQILNTESWVLPTSGICALSPPPLLSVQHRPPKLQSYHKAVSLALLSNNTQSPQTSNAPNYSYSDHLTTAGKSNYNTSTLGYHQSYANLCTYTSPAYTPLTHPVIPPHPHPLTNTPLLSAPIPHMPTHPPQSLTDNLPLSTEHTNIPHRYPTSNPPTVHSPQMQPIAELNDSPIRSSSPPPSTAPSQSTEPTGMSPPFHSTHPLTLSTQPVIPHPTLPPLLRTPHPPHTTLIPSPNHTHL